jgi:hypothetical protein
MRVIIGLAVSGLAVACVAIAAAAGWPGAGQATQSLAIERATITLTAAGASYLSPTRLTEVTGADIRVTDTIRGAAEDGFPAIAVWHEVNSAYDTTNRQPLEPTSRTFAFDRTTGELVDCCDQNLNGNAAVPQRGIAGWAFPRPTRKRTYPVFDPTAGAPEPLAYSGTAEVGGIRAYRFEENISAAPAGFSLLSTTDPQRYSVHRTYWVDPATGALLKLSENEDLYLIRPFSGAIVTHVFTADLTTTPASVASLVRQDTRARIAGAPARGDRLLFLVLAGGLAVAAEILSAFAPGGGVASRPARGAGRARRATVTWSPLPEADK